MPVLYNALDLKRGATVESREMGYNPHVQPPQMVLDKDKTEEWKCWNMDWMEQVGLSQLRDRAKGLSKNYRLAIGIIDKSDYIPTQDNPMADVIDFLTKDDDSALEIKYYPIIPNVINVLLGEQSKRINKVELRAIDEFSVNEKIETKRQMIQDSLLADARAKIQEQLAQMGVDVESEQGQQEMQKVYSLPEIDTFMKKTYKGLIEQWGTGQMASDVQRFRMDELESSAFFDFLVTGMEFWHIQMREDDYEIELWNPIFTFFHSSPEVKYASQGNYVGNIQLMSPSDIIDKFGWMMNEDQMLMLEQTLPNLNRGLLADGRPFEDYYDPSIPHDKQVPSQNLWFNKEVSQAAYKGQLRTDDLLYELNNIKSDLFERHGFMRVTQCYWKSKRKKGLVTKVNELGEVDNDWVNENYEIIEKPLYDNTVNPNKTADNLIYGEHVEWVWVNETWKGIKIGSQNSSIYGKTAPGTGPIYLGIEPLPFQLKGDYSIWGCRLPVEGIIGERNTRLHSLVDLMKPFQIVYNIVNNQINDILIDELGSIIMLDQNNLPKYSMGEEWGKGNMAKAYMAMKNFQILPLDHSRDNTGEPINYNQHNVLDLSQTQRLLGRVELAKYFREQAFEAVGITEQRLGNVTASETATGTQQAVNNSYAQTEMYFVKHMNHVMPRVKEAMLNVAQYYHSNKKSIRLSYMNSKDEEMFFEEEGTKLLARDYEVYCTTKPDSRAILEKLQQLAINNNTSGASLYDLAQIIQSDSPAQVAAIMKASQEKQEAMQQQQATEGQQLQQQQIEYEERRLKEEQEFEASENEKDREAKITEAEIRSSATANLKDSDDSGLAFAKQTADEYFRDRDMQHKERMQNSKDLIESRKIAQKDREINSRERIAQTQLKIAKENKTNAELEKIKKAKEQAAKAKKKK